MSETQHKVPPTSHRAKIDRVIERLAAEVPDDPKPGCTRALLAYLRTLQACGEEEMWEAILNNLYASFAAVTTDCGSVTEATVVMVTMFRKVSEDFLRINDSDSNGATATERQP